MESPVVVDKPPEYHGGERGFPFDDEDEGRWSESFSARHPDIAAHLRHRPANWTSKRRPSSQDADDFADRFGTFDRLNFNDIPGFREHFPAEWNRRFGPREEPQPHPHPHPQQPQPQTSQSPPRHQTIATQTDHNLPEDNVQTNLPQYGLRNTVDLGQKSAADPSLVDAEDRNQRSMSAPPDSRSHANMSAQGHPEHRAEPQVVRQIPIQVEGRDKPVINTFVDTSTHFADNKPYQANVDRADYFANDAPTGIHHPPNMQKSFGTFHKHGQQPPQPFSQQKMYPQSAARGGSPHRTQPPQPPAGHAPHDHQQQQPPPADNRQPPRQPPNQPPPASPPPPPPETPAPPKPQPTPVDPITQILAIQTDVLNLMTDVEKFTGTKKDKNYIYLDEMLTRNLIKLDLIETDGKDNIRTARKEAIKCIQKCIAVLEAKAEKASQEEVKEDDGGEKPNGEVDMSETGEPATGSPQEGEAARGESAAPPLETETVPKERGSRNKKPATKGPNARDKSKEKPEEMQVEETVQQLDEAMEEDAPSQ